MFHENLLLVDSEWFENYRAERETFIKDFSGDLSALNLQELKAQLRKPILEMTESGASVHVNGPLSMEGPDVFDLLMGNAGVSYGEIIDAVAEAHASLPIGAEISIFADTPGGGVNGAEQTYRAIFNTAKTRTVKTIVGSTVASAGVWALAGSTEILASGESSKFGNMGVIVTVKDRSELMSKIGIQEKTFVNTKSQDKNPDVKTVAGEKVITTLLDDIFGVFEKNEIEGRRGKTSAEKIEALNGALVVAHKAIDAGLIDGFVNAEVSGSSGGLVASAGIVDDQSRVESGTIIKNKLPAEAAGLTEEIDAMNLQEAIAQNPALQKEIDALVKEGFEAGAAKEQGKIEARVTAAKPILSSKVYAGTKAFEIAAMVVTGEKSVETMDAVLAVLDINAEGDKSDKAKKETEEIEIKGGTPPIDPAGDKLQAEQSAVDARMTKLAGLQ